MDLKQGDLENIILNALWDLEKEGSEKIFVGDIQSRIKSPKKKWAYTTVKTVLDRLVDKEIATRHKDGKKYLYRSVVNRDEAGVMAIQKVMRQYFKDDVTQLLDCLGQLDHKTERASVANRLQETREKLASR
ncbi:MAG: BlaI/MecI/CopY family transcriptional regulator [Vampirovibrionales bacterium]|nr:BlaI/MecI/CopY family transcriptional regulator [Vampirovibrionales bacterium]